MQIVSARLCKTGRIGHSGLNVSTLGLNHSIKYVHVTVYGIGGTKSDRHQILMDIGESGIKVEQILMAGTVTHNGRRELLLHHFSGTVLRVIYGIIESKGQTSVLYVIFNVMNIINVYKSAKEGEHTIDNRCILVCKVLLLSSQCKLGRRKHLGVKIKHLVALSLIVLLKFCDVFRHNAGIPVNLTCNFCSIGAGFLCYFT